MEAETPNICLTPLHVAALMGQVASLHSLLDASANPGATTKQGHSALHLAAMRDYDEVVGLLLEYGADVQAPDAGGRTPLDWARETLSWNVARLLDASISIV